jgi:hypothetical protein
MLLVFLFIFHLFVVFGGTCCYHLQGDALTLNMKFANCIDSLYDSLDGVSAAYKAATNTEQHTQ